MKAAPFTLHRPATVEEAVSLMARYAEDGGLVLAGGQSLTPMMALRVAYPPHLVDINNVAGLDSLTAGEGYFGIGATVRHARFHRPVPEAGRLGEVLATVVRHIAHYPIRQRGTFCGSLAHADPASEWCLVAATLDADLRLVGEGGERLVPVSEFIDGAMSTVREPEEILVEARLPLLAKEVRFGFYEFNRRAGDFALGMALVVYDLDGGVMRNVRVGLGGIEEKARRIGVAEAALEGQAASAEAFAAAAAATVDDVEAMEDATTSQAYRRDLSGVVVRRALEASLDTDTRGTE
ncbi:FAD binding domain-containing protein [Microbaculum marinum]|uniref:FAD binding domain-containing protein n=1 Tax=Microbaculum marinum TaxID=1764581 RepID=A0AAW9RDP7_9HYPH